MFAWLSGVDLRKVTRGSSARRPPNDGLKVDNDGCSHRVPCLASTWILLSLVFLDVASWFVFSWLSRDYVLVRVRNQRSVYIISCERLRIRNEFRWCVEAAAGEGCPSGQDGSVSCVIGENLMMMKRRLHPSETLKGRKTVY